MKYWLKHFIIKFPIIINAINYYYNIRNKSFFKNEVERRKHISLFDYKQLVDDLPYAPSDMVIDNNIYGISYCLKKYAGVDTRLSLDGYVEHGVFFGDLVRKDQCVYPVSSIITFGSKRISHLKKKINDKKIKAIGPLIYYAESLLSVSDCEKLKKDLGRTLLVFPSHSIIGINSNFDNDEFIKEIKKRSADFDTVLISLYWTDVNNLNLVNSYENLGFKIVTSGHRFDFNFLPRQRSLIELSDYTMSNSVGTHIGYCICLNKPHYVFYQKIENVGLTKKDQKYFDSVRNYSELASEELEKKSVLSVFNNYESDITNDQRVIVDEYWGMSFVCGKSELRAILFDC